MLLSLEVVPRVDGQSLPGSVNEHNDQHDAGPDHERDQQDVHDEQVENRCHDWPLVQVETVVESDGSQEMAIGQPSPGRSDVDGEPGEQSRSVAHRHPQGAILPEPVTLAQECEPGLEHHTHETFAELDHFLFLQLFRQLLYFRVGFSCV